MDVKRHFSDCVRAFINHNNILPHHCKFALCAFTEPNLLLEVQEDNIEQWQTMPTFITVDPEDTGNDNMSIYNGTT